MLMNRKRRNDQHVVGAKQVGFAVVDFPAFATQAEQSRRADMAMRAPRRRSWWNIGEMGGEIVDRRAIENVIANDVSGLMRAAAAHHRTLHRQKLDHASRLFFQKLFVALMRQRIARL